MGTPQPERAFKAAAFALLVLPLLVLLGIMVLGLMAELMIRMDRMTGGHAYGVLLAMFIGWVVLSIGAVLVFVSRYLRRTTRS